MVMVPTTSRINTVSRKPNPRTYHCGSSSGGMLRKGRISGRENSSARPKTHHRTSPVIHRGAITVMPAISVTRSRCRIP